MTELRDEMPEFITYRDVVRATGLHFTTVKRLVQAGVIGELRYPFGQPRLIRADVDAMIEGALSPRRQDVRVEVRVVHARPAEGTRKARPKPT
jgi:hypothetical protein